MNRTELQTGISRGKICIGFRPKNYILFNFILSSQL